MERVTDVSRFLNGLVHWDTQQALQGADLTVDQVFRLTGPGQLDFGGSEFAPAPRERLSPTLADPEDSYGWWQLDKGMYIVRYNEGIELVDRHHARLTPLPRLLQAGAMHPTRVLNESEQPLEMLVTVGGGGCNLKENCRISRVEVFVSE